jgi:hypothetical protein
VQDKQQSMKNIKVGISGEFSSKSTGMSHDASNQSFCNKASNNIYNVHVNTIQSKANNSILNPIGNDVGQHGSMKNNNNVIMSMSQSDKFQLESEIYSDIILCVFQMVWQIIVAAIVRLLMTQ